MSPERVVAWEGIALGFTLGVYFGVVIEKGAWFWAAVDLLLLAIAVYYVRKDWP